MREVSGRMIGFVLILVVGGMGCETKKAEETVTYDKFSTSEVTLRSVPARESRSMNKGEAEQEADEERDDIVPPWEMKIDAGRRAAKGEGASGQQREAATSRGELRGEHRPPGMRGAEQKDRDGDAIPDARDNCPKQPNRAQIDSDDDGVGNTCDGCAGDPVKTEPGACGCGIAERDDDEDGVADCVDNCVELANVDQRDFDGDGKGDACDTDIDGDGIANRGDVCAETPRSDRAAGGPELDVVSDERWVYEAEGGSATRAFATYASTGGAPPPTLTIEDTHGCSCMQIVKQFDLPQEFRALGCTRSAVRAWIDFVENNP